MKEGYLVPDSYWSPDPKELLAALGSAEEGLSLEETQWRMMIIIRR